MRKNPVLALKKCIHFSLAMSMILPAASFAQQKPDSALRSKESFRSLIKDPDIYAANIESLRETIKVPADHMGTDFFENNPFFQTPEMQEASAEVMKAGETDAVIQGQTSMTRIDANTYPAVWDIIAGVASDYGYTEEQISKIEAFIMPDMNASMASASLDHPVLFIGKPLIDAMTKQYTNKEYQRKIGIQVLRGIIGHEFGHNIASHVLRGFQFNAMMVQLAAVFAKNVGFGSINFNDLENFNFTDAKANGMSQNVHDYWNNIFQKFNILDVNPVAKTDPLIVNRQKKIFLNYLKQVNAAARGKSEVLQERARTAFNILNGQTMSSPDLGPTSVLEFLKLVIRIEQMVAAPPATANYFKSLLREFSNALDEGREPFQRDADEFMKYTTLAMANFSQVMEMSADRGGLTMAPWEQMSVGFLTFKNAQLDPILAGLPKLSPKELRRRLLDQARAEWRNFLTKNSMNDILQAMGGSTYDHPVPLRRLMDFYVGARTTGTLGRRNEFNKHVVIYNQLMKQVREAQQTIDSRPALFITNLFKAVEEKLQSSGVVISPKEQEAALEGMKKQIENLELFKARALAGAEKVSDAIMTLLNDPFLNRFDARNTRLLNFIEFQLAVRQDNLSVFNEMVGSVEDPQQKEQVRSVLQASLPDFNTPLIQKVNAQLVAEKSIKGADLKQIGQRLAEIKVLVSKDTTISDIEKARTQNLAYGKAENRETRVPVVKPKIDQRITGMPVDFCRPGMEKVTD